MGENAVRSDKDVHCTSPYVSGTKLSIIRGKRPFLENAPLEIVQQSVNMKYFPSDICSHINSSSTLLFINSLSLSLIKRLL